MGPSGRVRQSILADLATGRLMPGAPCPTDRVLARRTGVARGTAQAVLRSLQAEGVLERQGRGRRVTLHRMPSRSSGLGALWPDIVAIAAPVIGAHRSWATSPGWPHHAVHGAQSAIQQAGLHALLLHQDLLRNGDAERVLRPPPLGLLLIEPGMIRDVSRVMLERLAGRELAVVVVGDETGFESFDRVVSDHAAGAGLLVRQLVASGRRRIVQLVGRGAMPAWEAERCRGYLAAMAHARLRPRQPQAVDFDVGDDPPVMVAKLARQLRPLLRGAEPPDAILAPSDGQALMTSAAIRHLGLVPGTDVVVTGYDGYWRESPLLASFPDPPWATIDKDNCACGSAAVDLLRQRISGKLPKKVQRRVLTPHVLLSGTGPPLA